MNKGISKEEAKRWIHHFYETFEMQHTNPYTAYALQHRDNALRIIDQINEPSESDTADEARTDVLHLAIGRITELMEKVGHPKFDFNGGLRSGYLNAINVLLSLKTKDSPKEEKLLCDKHTDRCECGSLLSTNPHNGVPICVGCGCVSKALNAHERITLLMERITKLEKGKKK